MTLTVFRTAEAASPTLVSVLVPVYNVEKYLEETLRSILAQTYPDLEVVLLDDGSEDDSMAVAQRLKREDSRILILPGAGVNRGVVATRNELLRHASGAFICWHDSDDVSHPERFERQLRFLQRNSHFGAVGTGIIIADENLMPQRSETYPADPERQASDPMLCCATLMARREAASGAGCFREVFRAGGEDGDWIMKMADRHAVTNIPDILYTYRRHARSLTHDAANSVMSVRLGVVARWSARARRAGQADPVDVLELPRLHEQLSAWAFIDNTALGRLEKMTALGRLLPGEAPAISILHDFVGEVESVQRLAVAYDAQTFANFEILLAVRPEAADRFRAALQSVKCAIRIVPSAAQTPWLDLTGAARGRFVMYWTSKVGLPAPWEVHNFVDLALSQEGRPDDHPPGNFLWRDVSLAEISTGQTHRLILPAAALAALTADRSGSITVRGVQVLGKRSLFSHLIFRTKTVYRDRGARGVMEVICRRLLAVRRFVEPATAPAFAAAQRLRKLAGPRVLGVATLPLNALFRLKVIFRNHGTSGVLRAVWLKLDVTARRGEPAAKRLSPDFAAAAAEARLKVAVYECWGDFVDSLYYLTPGSSSLVEGVMFAPAELVPDPDFILVLNTPAAATVSVVAPPERLWFAVGEPPTPMHRPFHRGQGEASTVVTCDLSLPDGQDPGRTYIHEPVMTRTWHVKRTYDEIASGALPPKDKKLSWVTSNLRILDGHRYRMSFLEKLKSRVEFDLYGRGFRPVCDKWDAIAPYQYSIAFENTAAPLYFTEKLMDCFVCGTLPFYYGDPELEKRFPSRSFIRIDPEDPRVFDMIRDVSASDMWRERQADIAEARELVLTRYNLYRILALHMLEAARRPPAPPTSILIQRQAIL
ncbi:glycosyltransferase [Rhodoplanes sp. SY1]|uniref:glycosyltransferase n=1 Tax=Rhodoplanes sp. SY1 TaxID=3166646 RepID=UPI0038B5944C